MALLYNASGEVAASAAASPQEEDGGGGGVGMVVR